MSTGTNRKIWPLIVSFALLTTAPTFAGKSIYINDDRPADFNNIQDAINFAGDGDMVIVAEGWYFELWLCTGSKIITLRHRLRHCRHNLLLTRILPSKPNYHPFPA